MEKSCKKMNSEMSSFICKKSYYIALILINFIQGELYMKQEIKNIKKTLAQHSKRGYNDVRLSVQVETTEGNEVRYV